ncbi:MAG: GAF domain-containing protein [Chloroflexi bacterium]|nr:GAF domain-containing protein [Chloroflexota bacterium]
MNRSKHRSVNLTRRQIQFSQALNRAAEILQRGARSETDVCQIIGEQIVELGLHGMLAMLDATRENFVVRALAQSPRAMRVIAQIERATGMQMRGFSFPATQVEIIQQVLVKSKAIWTPRSWDSVLQMIPPIARSVVKPIANPYAAHPGICAPILMNDQARGVLLISGQDLSQADLPAIQAFANHIAIAIENARLYTSLRASEERFRAFIEQGSDLFFLLDPTGAIQYASPSTERLLGYSADHAMGKRVFDFIHPDDLPETTRAFEHRLAHPGAADTALHARVRHRDGAWRVLEVIGNNLLDNHTMQGIVLTCRDVTDRARAEESSRASEARLRTAFENLPFDFWVCNREGRYIAQNSTSLQHWGNVIGKCPEELDLPAGILEKWRANNTRALAGEIVTDEAEYIQNGARCTYFEIISPVREAGEIQGILGVNLDITERKRAEDTLRAREQYLTALNDITRAALAAQDFATLTQTLADQLGRMLNSDECFITVWDAEHQRTIPASASAESRDTYSRVRVQPGEMTMTESVLRAGHPLVAEDVFNTPYIAPRIAAAYPTRSMLGLPLIANNRKLGAALIGFNSPHHFTEDEIARGEQAARHIALAFAQAHLLQETRARAAELEAVRQASITLTTSLDLKTVLNSILDGVLRLASDANDTHVFLFANDHLSFGAARYADIARTTPWAEPRRDGVTYTVAQTGLPFIIPHTSTHPLYTNTDADWGGSIVSLPLKIGERVVGVMNVAYWQPREFDPAFVRALQLLGDQAALAIENARLYQAERARAAELEAVRRATITLTSSLDLASVLRSILNSAFALIPLLNNAHIFLYRDDKLIFGAARAADDFLDAPFAEPRENGLTYSVARSGEIISVREQKEHPLFADLPRDWRGSIIGLPLKIGAQVVGVMNLAFQAPRDLAPSEVETLGLLGDQAALAIENARLFEAERAARAQSEILRQAAQAVSTSLNLSGLLESILEQLKRVIPNDTASVLLFDANGAPELIAGMGYANELETNRAAKTLLKDSRILAQMMRDQQPVNLPDVHQHPDWIWVEGAEHVSAFLGVPIIAGQRMIGVLMIDHHLPNTFHATDVQLAQTFAQHLAVPLENARLFEQTQQRAREFAALYETARDLAGQTEMAPLLDTIIERVMRALDVPDGVIYLYDSARDELITATRRGLPFPLHTHLSSSAGVSGFVVRTRQPQIIDDYEHWEHRRPEYAAAPLRAVAQVPILYSGELIGILGVAELAPSTRKFNDNDLRLLSLFASQTASAVHHARLHAETQQRAQQLAALSDITRDLATQHDASILIQSITERAVALLGASSGSVHLYDATRDDLELALSTRFLSDVGVRRKMNEGLVGRVATSRQTIIANDYATMSDRLPQYDSIGMSALICTPMLYGGALIGVLTVNEFAPSTRRFTQTDADLLTLFAGHAASAIHNARLLAETQQGAEQLAW